VQLLVPFAGPFLFAADHPRDTVLNESGSPLSSTTKALLYTSAGLQIAGMVSIFTALAVGRHEPAPAAPARATLPAPSLSIAPMSAPGAVGLSVGFYRW
jgi:hypothetical protein